MNFIFQTRYNSEGKIIIYIALFSFTASILNRKVRSQRTHPVSVVYMVSFLGEKSSFSSEPTSATMFEVKAISIIETPQPTKGYLF
jgi:hypothetical protein